MTSSSSLHDSPLSFCFHPSIHSVLCSSLLYTKTPSRRPVLLHSELCLTDSVLRLQTREPWALLTFTFTNLLHTSLKTLTCPPNCSWWSPCINNIRCISLCYSPQEQTTQNLLYDDGSWQKDSMATFNLWMVTVVTENIFCKISFGLHKYCLKITHTKKKIFFFIPLCNIIGIEVKLTDEIVCHNLSTKLGYVWMYVVGHNGYQ